MILTATLRDSRKSAASYTAPMPPLPISRSRRYLPSIVRSTGNDSVSSDPSVGHTVAAAS